jgi:hypothetical protein
VINHRVLAMPLRVSALRCWKRANVFAPNLVDEIAAASGEDPSRGGRHLSDRGRGGDQRVAAESRWSQWKARRRRPRRFARYAGAYCTGCQIEARRSCAAL